MKKLQQIKDFTGNKIYEAIISGYPESTKLILSGESKQFEDKYPEIYKDLLSCRKKADDRTLYTYARNLIYSWILEDFVRLMLKSYLLLPVATGGSDRDRVLQNTKSVKSDSDLMVKLDSGEIVNIEFITDYTGYATMRRHFHLRKGKLPNLKRESRRTFLMYIDLSSRKFFFRDVNRLKSFATYNTWQKPVDQVDITFDIMSISPDNIRAYFTSEILDNRSSLPARPQRLATAQ